MITNYKDSNGVDLGNKLVPKSYLIDRYPDLLDNFRYAGLWGWGQGVGDGTTENKSFPVQISSNNTTWRSISGSKSQLNIRTTAIKTDNTLWTWANTQSPAQVGNNTDWRISSTGGDHTLAIKTNGTLWAWGTNSAGQLGTGDTVHRSTPVQIGSDSDWRTITAGNNFSLAIKTNGNAWVWGRNNYGQLGTSNTADKSSPIQIDFTGGWKLIGSGWYVGLGTKTDGSLWTWGWNMYGQLGTGDTLSKSTPTQIANGGWTALTGGRYHTLAVKSDGTLWAWGHNFYGSLGSGDTVYRSTPTQTIAGGTTWKLVCCGQYHSVAIKTDGSLWNWGYNLGGILGDGEPGSNKSSPIQILANSTNWKAISAIRYATNAIRDEYEDLI